MGMLLAIPFGMDDLLVGAFSAFGAREFAFLGTGVFASTDAATGVFSGRGEFIDRCVFIDGTGVFTGGKGESGYGVRGVRGLSPITLKKIDFKKLFWMIRGYLIAPLVVRIGLIVDCHLGFIVCSLP
jgi:hypothetical protein